MQNDKITKNPDDYSVEPQEDEDSPDRLSGAARIWENLVSAGFGESAVRVATGVVSISFFLIVIWLMGSLFLHSQPNAPRQAVKAEVVSTVTPTVAMPAFDLSAIKSDLSAGITRLALMHTTIPTRPRNDLAQYTVLKGDNIFAIAEKFNLKPESIMWGNRYTLGEDPELIRPGQVLIILPLDGAYHKWSAGEGLNGVAKFYGVKPEDIINYPGNHLTLEAVGDFSRPNIPPDTMLIIPGGHGVFSDRKAPLITRANAASANYLGPGACKNVLTGAVGSSTFIWPSTMRSISGYHYQPAINHYGIDIAGDYGYPIFATDSGVIVFAGPSELGYGNEIVIDHGNGWQSLYAHLSVINVSCGQSVSQGVVIGAMGSTGHSTGPHLHFELRNDKLGRVDPMNFLR
jgi:hypothetical protein